METTQVFAVQFLLSATAWTLLSWRFAVPALTKLRREEALAWLVAPQMFRHIGMTLLAPGVTSPELPAEFARSVAYGDLATAVLAVSAFAALKLRGQRAFPLVWLMNVVGFADLVRNTALGFKFEVGPLLHAGCVIPTFLVPLMAISHLMIFARLLKRRA